MRKLYYILFSFIGLCSLGSFAQETTNKDSRDQPVSTKSHPQTGLLRITELGFGGMAIKVSTFNDQIAIMNGGCGYATINERFTIGGSGYGVGNNINLPSDDPTVYNFFKMGYGGLELGYFLLKGKRANVSATMLVGLGAAFTESVPKRENRIGFRGLSGIRTCYKR